MYMFIITEYDMKNEFSLWKIHKKITMIWNIVRKVTKKVEQIIGWCIIIAQRDVHHLHKKFGEV